MTTFEWGKKDFIDQKAKVSENQEQVLSDEQKKAQQEKQQQALKSAKEATKKEAEKSAQELPNLNDAYDDTEWKKVEKWNDDEKNSWDWNMLGMQLEDFFKKETVLSKDLDSMLVGWDMLKRTAGAQIILYESLWILDKDWSIDTKKLQILLTDQKLSPELKQQATLLLWQLQKMDPKEWKKQQEQMKLLKKHTDMSRSVVWYLNGEIDPTNLTSPTSQKAIVNIFTRDYWGYNNVVDGIVSTNSEQKKLSENIIKQYINLKTGTDFVNWTPISVESVTDKFAWLSIERKVIVIWSWEQKQFLEFGNKGQSQKFSEVVNPQSPDYIKKLYNMNEKGELIIDKKELNKQIGKEEFRKKIAESIDKQFLDSNNSSSKTYKNWFEAMGGMITNFLNNPTLNGALDSMKEMFATLMEALGMWKWWYTVERAFLQSMKGMDSYLKTPEWIEMKKSLWIENKSDVEIKRQISIRSSRFATEKDDKDKEYLPLWWEKHFFSTVLTPKEQLHYVFGTKDQQEKLKKWKPSEWGNERWINYTEFSSKEGRVAINTPVETKDTQQNPNIIKVKGLDDKNYPDGVAMEIKWEWDNKYIKINSLILPVIDGKFSTFWLSENRSVVQKYDFVLGIDNKITFEKKDTKLPKNIDPTKIDIKDNNIFNLWKYKLFSWVSDFAKNNVIDGKQEQVEQLIVSFMKKIESVPRNVNSLKNELIEYRKQLNTFTKYSSRTDHDPNINMEVSL